MSQEKITIKGSWWRPDEPETKLPGEITYSPVDGATVSVYGAFAGGNMNTRFTLWGISAKGESLTLFHCHVSNLQHYASGNVISEIFSRFGVIGGHFSSEIDIKMTSMSYDLSNLNHWLARSQIRARVELTPKDGFSQFQFDLLEPKETPLLDHGDFSLSLCPGMSVSPQHGELVIKETCTAKIKCKVPSCWDDFQAII